MSQPPAPPPERAPGTRQRAQADARAAAPSPKGERLVGWARPWPVQALGWVLVLLACYPALWDKTGAPRFKLDAWIYQHAVAQWHAGGSLYDWYANPDQHLWPFTYPPFAAWALTPLTWLGDRTSQVLMVLATPVCVALTVWALTGCLGRLRGPDAAALVPWGTLAAVAVIEPVYKSMEYGQVNAQLMALVAVDLLVVPSSSRWRGVLSGLAAAFKLTPAIAVLFLLARREWRAAATMTGTAVGVTALAWVVSPTESAQFFGSAMWDPSRAGFADYSGNQNLKGLVARAMPEAAWTPVWAVAVALVLAGAWVVLRRIEHASRSRLAATDGSPARDDQGVTAALELSVVMVTGLLISPISWSHHWVWMVVAVAALAVAGWRWRAPALTACAVAGGAVAVLAMQWWFPEQNHVEQGWPVWARVVGSSYTLWALASAVVLYRAVPHTEMTRCAGQSRHR